MKIESIHHVAIIASDYQKSKHFYTQILGFEIINETYREERESFKLDLKVGNSQIELFSFPNAPERPDRPEAVGLRHLCFSVKNIKEVVNELTDSGVRVESIRMDPYTNKAYTFFKDPDGLPLELYEM